MERMPRTVQHELTMLVERYEPPYEAMEFVGEHPPLVMCGITSAGKDTVAHELIDGGGYELVVSHTTRNPRSNNGKLEEHGTHYFFTSKADMLELVRQQKFFEVKPVHDNFYGTSIDALRKPYEHHNRALLVIDFKGALDFISFIPKLRPIFLLPPDLATWQQRLSGRGQIDETQFRTRLQSAAQEIQTALDDPSFLLLVNYEKSDTAMNIRHGFLGRDHSAVDVAEILLHQIRAELNQ